ncbi:methyltransferase family protein [Moraxella canis]|uniref:methyltransferase family protein n=1 Tax=Moraxella canis TaxID=90239 RepID=UPI0006665903|nr:isoprenylcysteine carboxylmethyltransferase family protein [Moraxella canis]
MSLELKIPPVILMVIVAIVMTVQAQFSIMPFRLPWLIAGGIAILGCGIIGMAVWQFQQAKTTVNPLNPNQSRQIVNTGIFAISRNPMYAGMAVILISVAVFLGEFSVFIWVAGFILYMTRFQIKPEERILTKNFGDDYTRYCKKVRRWI